jgi:uncharacterized protein YbjT (DUF2867 family)
MILVTGATGTNGLEIVKLLSRSGVRCRALVRNPENATLLSDLPGVEVVPGDLARDETLEPALEGIDKALLCSSIGPELADVQGNFVRAAKRAGVRYVLRDHLKTGHRGSPKIRPMGRERMAHWKRGIQLARMTPYSFPLPLWMLALRVQPPAIR